MESFIHRIKNLEIKPLHKQDSDTWVRDIVVETDQGKHEITLFSNNKPALGIKM